MKQCFYFLLLLLLPYSGVAQYLTGAGTKWGDEFTEWIIYTDDEELQGELIMRWQNRNDWSEWDYRIGDVMGGFKLVWQNDPGQWELRGNGRVITARTVYPRDFRQWRITDNSHTLVLRSRWTNNFNEWQLRDDEFGNLDIYTQWEDDPREWIITDELDERISLEMKLTAVFLALLTSAPK
ncbi:MAG: hypothetical protein AAGG75_07185 [Bacteroidota bacterium]